MPDIHALLLSTRVLIEPSHDLTCQLRLRATSYSKTNQANSPFKADNGRHGACSLAHVSYCLRTNVMFSISIKIRLNLAVAEKMLTI